MGYFPLVPPVRYAPPPPPVTEGVPLRSISLYKNMALGAGGAGGVQIVCTQKAVGDINGKGPSYVSQKVVPKLSNSNSTVL